jgi:hypothetical protein
LRSISQLLERYRPNNRSLICCEAAGIGLFDWDLENNQASYTPAFWAMLARPPADTFDSFSNLLHPDDASAVLERIDSCRSKAAMDYSCTFRLRHAEGRWLWINAKGKAVSGHLCGVHIDISSLLKEEAENLSHLSHQLRTPLAAVSGIAEILESASSDFGDRHKSLIKTLSSSVKALKELVNEISAQARKKAPPAQAVHQGESASDLT